MQPTDAHIAGGTGGPFHAQIISIGTGLPPRIPLKFARARRELEVQATTSCGMYYSGWPSRCYKYSSNRERERLDVRHLESMALEASRVLLYCVTIGSSAAMSRASRSAVINMWPYRTIGKTCMHSLTASPSSTVQTADVRWYAKAIASPVLPHARVCITSTLRVQTECYGYFECLCSASVTSASNGSRRKDNGVERTSTSLRTASGMLTQRMGAFQCAACSSLNNLATSSGKEATKCWPDTRLR
jgi:hypothetical protein